MISDLGSSLWWAEVYPASFPRWRKENLAQGLRQNDQRCCLFSKLRTIIQGSEGLERCFLGRADALPMMAQQVPEVRSERKETIKLPHLYVGQKMVSPNLWIWASKVAPTVKNPPSMRETGVRSLGGEDPLEEDTAGHSRVLPGESHGQRRLAG